MEIFNIFLESRVLPRLYQSEYNLETLQQFANWIENGTPEEVDPEYVKMQLFKYLLKGMKDIHDTTKVWEPYWLFLELASTYTGTPETPSDQPTNMEVDGEENTEEPMDVDTFDEEYMEWAKEFDEQEMNEHFQAGEFPPHIKAGMDVDLCLDRDTVRTAAQRYVIETYDNMTNVPGDGSCLLHCLSAGYKNGTFDLGPRRQPPEASTLREHLNKLINDDKFKKALQNACYIGGSFSKDLWERIIQEYTPDGVVDVRVFHTFCVYKKVGCLVMSPHGTYWCGPTQENGQPKRYELEQKLMVISIVDLHAHYKVMKFKDFGAFYNPCKEIEIHSFISGIYSGHHIQWMNGLAYEPQEAPPEDNSEQTTPMVPFSPIVIPPRPPHKATIKAVKRSDPNAPETSSSSSEDESMIKDDMTQKSPALNPFSIARSQFDDAPDSSDDENTSLMDRRYYPTYTKEQRQRIRKECEFEALPLLSLDDEDEEETDSKQPASTMEEIVTSVSDDDSLFKTVSEEFMKYIPKDFTSVSQKVSLTVNVVSIISSIVTLVRMYWIGVDAISLVSQLVTLAANVAALVCTAKAMTSLSEMTKMAIKYTIGSWTNSPMAYAARASPDASLILASGAKIAALIACVAGAVSGYKGEVQAVGSALSAARGTHSLINEIGNVFESVYNSEKREEMKEKCDGYDRKLQEFISMNGYQMVGQTFTNAKALTEEVKTFIADSKTFCDAQSIRNLSGNLQTLKTKLTSLIQALRSNESAPTPVALHVHGEPGIGKSQVFSGYFERELAKRIKKFSESFQAIPSTVRHFPIWTGSPTLLFDEFGANAQIGEGNIISHINGIISGVPMVTPTANVEDKNQVIKPKLIVAISNSPCSHTLTGYTDAANNAFRSRFNCYQFSDPQYDPNIDNARNAQVHRKSDFSHLEIYKCDIDGGRVRKVSMKEMLDETAAMIYQNHQNFNATKKKQQDDRVMQYKAYSGDTRTCVAVIAGNPGTGKDTVLIPPIMQECTSFGYKRFLVLPDTPQSQMEVILQYTENCVVIMNDSLPLDDKENQQKLKAFIDKCKPNHHVLIVTNFGPRIGLNNPIAWWRLKDKYQPLDYLMPGLDRRLGFDLDQTATHTLFLTHDKFYGLTDAKTGKHVSETAVFQHFYKFDTDKDGFILLDSIPHDGFKREEADVWVEMRKEEATAYTLITATMCGTSLRAKAFAATLKPGEYKGGDLSVPIKRTMIRAVKAMKDPKMYFKIGNKEYWFDGCRYYFGETTTRTDYDSQTKEYITRDLKRYQLNYEYVAIANQVASTPTNGRPKTDMPDELLIPLVVDVTSDSPTWQRIVKDFPVAKLKQGKDDQPWYKRSWESFVCFYMWVKSSWIFMALVHILCSVLTIVISVKVIQWMTRKKTEDDTCIFECRHCSMTGNKVAYEHPCPAALESIDDHRALAGKSKLAKFVMRNGTKMMTSDLETHFDERALHDIRKEAITKNRIGETWDTEIGGVRVKAFTKRDNDNGDIIIGWNVQDSVATAGLRNPFRNNQVRAENSRGGNLYGIALNNYLVRIGTHLWGTLENKNARVELTSHPGKWLRPVQVLPQQDITYCLVEDFDGNFSPIDGIKDITSSLLSGLAISHIKDCVIADPETNTMLTEARFKYNATLAVPIHGGDTQEISKQVAFIYTSVMPRWVKVGSCGAMCFTYINDKPYLLGQLAGDAIGSHTYYPIITTEEFSEVARLLNTPLSGESKTIEVSWFRQDNPLTNRPIYTAKEYAFALSPPKDTDFQFGSGMKLKGRIKSFVKVDQSTRKRRLAKGAFIDVFGDLKAPALSQKEIETNWKHKLEPDCKGNIFFLSPKLARAMENRVTMSPEIQTKKEILSVCAKQIAEWVKKKTGVVNVEPLDKLTAIWGNGTSIEPLKRTASVGTGVTYMFNHVLKKSDIITDKRGLFIGWAGQRISEITDDQWDHWKQGKMYDIPAGLSAKQECLALDKVWKKRSVMNVAFPTVVNQKRIIQPIQVLFQKLGMASPLLVCFDPIADYHQFCTNVQKYKHHVSIDTSQFDGSVPYYLHDAVGTLLKEIYSAKIPLSNAIDCCMESVRASPILAGELFVTKEAGQNSGAAGTSCTDGLIGLLMVAYAGQLNEKSFEQVMDEQHCHFTGDDGGLHYNDDPPVPIESLLYVHNEVFGMETTSGAVKGEDATCVPLDEFSYASRKMSALPEHPHLWTGKLKPEAISSALCWTQTEDRVEQIEQIRQAGKEIALYPDEYYQRYEKVFRQEFPKENLKTLSEWRRIVKDEIYASLHKSLKVPELETTKLMLTDLLPLKPETIQLKKISQKYYPKQFDKMNIKKKLNELKKLFSAELFDEGAAKKVLDEISDISPDVTTNMVRLMVDGETYDVAFPDYYSLSYWTTLAKMAEVVPYQLEVISRADEPETLRASVKIAFNRAKAHATAFLMYRTTGSLEHVHAIYLHERRKQLEKMEAAHCNLFSDNNRALADSGTTAGGFPTARTEVTGSTTVQANEAAGLSPENPLAPMVAVNVEAPPVATSVATTEPDLDVPGFIQGVLNYQTGTGFNVLHSARIPRYKRLLRVNFPVSEDHIFLNEPIQLTNPNIMNNATKALLSMHMRMTGKLMLQMTCYGAANIVGAARFVIVPPYYDETMTKSQTNLDQFTPLEISLNTSGPITIPLPFMATKEAQTGVYIRKPDGTINDQLYGRLIGYIPVACYNTISSLSATFWQTRMAAYIGPETLFDMYIDPTEEVPVGLAYKPDLTGKTLVIDGSFDTGIEFPQEAVGLKMVGIEPNSSGVYNGVPVCGTGRFFVEDGLAPVQRYLMGGPPELLVANAQDGNDTFPEFLSSKTTDQDAIVTKTEVAVNGRDYVRLFDMDTIEYTNVMKTNGGSGDWYGLNRDFDQNWFSGDSGALKIAVLDDLRETQDGNKARGQLRMYIDSNELIALNDYEGPLSYSRNVYMATRIDTVPICTTGYVPTTEQLPQGFYSCKLPSASSFIPVVTSTISGNSMLEDALEVKFIEDAIKAIDDGFFESVIIQANSINGNFIADILVNRSGCFVRIDNPDYRYSLLNQSLSSENINTNAVFKTTKWPNEVRPIPLTYLNRRVQENLVANGTLNGKMAASVITSKRLKSLYAIGQQHRSLGAAVASMGAGAISGVGQGISDWQNREMQKDFFNKDLQFKTSNMNMQNRQVFANLKQNADQFDQNMEYKRQFLNNKAVGTVGQQNTPQSRLDRANRASSPTPDE